MAAILHEIGTPLQFVALFVLLLAGVARLLVRSPLTAGSSAAMTRLVINRIFAAGLVALVLGTLAGLGGPVLNRWVNGDEIIHGAVRSTVDDTVIDNATVDLVSIAKASVTSDGAFELTVPRNRVRRSYQLAVRAPGYRTSDQTISDADLRDATIKLTPAPPSPLIKGLESDFVVGQWLGLPVAMVTFRVENEADDQVTISDLRGTLSGPAGSFQVVPGVWTIMSPMGPFASPMPSALPIPARGRYDLKIVLGASADVDALYRRVTSLPEYVAQGPCAQRPSGSVDLPDDAAVKLVEDFANAHFAWRPGAWHLQVDAMAANQPQSLQRDFTLSAAEVEGLRASIGLIRQCLTVYRQTPFAQDGATANFLSK